MAEKKGAEPTERMLSTVISLIMMVFMIQILMQVLQQMQQAFAAIIPPTEGAPPTEEELIFEDDFTTDPAVNWDVVKGSIEWDGVTRCAFPDASARIIRKNLTVDYKCRIEAVGKITADVASAAVTFGYSSETSYYAAGYNSEYDRIYIFQSGVGDLATEDNIGLPDPTSDFETKVYWDPSSGEIKCQIWQNGSLVKEITTTNTAITSGGVGLCYKNVSFDYIKFVRES